MLPHNSFTSVAIAVLLLNWKSPYGLQEPKYKNPICAPKEDNWAWPPWVGPAGTEHPPT